MSFSLVSELPIPSKAGMTPLALWSDSPGDASFPRPLSPFYPLTPGDLLPPCDYTLRYVSPELWVLVGSLRSVQCILICTFYVTVPVVQTAALLRGSGSLGREARSLPLPALGFLTHAR